MKISYLLHLLVDMSGKNIQIAFIRDENLAMIKLRNLFFLKCLLIFIFFPGAKVRSLYFSTKGISMKLAPSNFFWCYCFLILTLQHASFFTLTFSFNLCVAINITSVFRLSLP